MSVIPSKLVVKSEEEKPNYKAIIAELRKHHEPVFKALEVEDALFYPKMFYQPLGKDEKYIGVFAGELRMGRDIYTEPVSREYIAEEIKDPHIAKRTLFKWPYNPHWEGEYELAASKSSSYHRYLIPIAELILVEMPIDDGPSPFKDSLDLIEDISKIQVKTKSLEISNLDKPISQLTLRELLNILKSININL